MTKRSFYRLFRSAYQKSFTEENIQGGFAKTEIWPFCPSKVLDTITRRPITPPEAENQALQPPPTPLTSKSIRRVQREYRKNPTPENLELIFRSQERLAA